MQLPLKKYDGNIYDTIKENFPLSIEDFAKIYDASTCENQLKSMLKCGMVKINQGVLIAQ